MNQFLESASQYIFGNSREASIYNRRCVSCGQDAKEFRSGLDQREYEISALCQHCQDEVFHSEN